MAQGVVLFIEWLTQSWAPGNGTSRVMLVLFGSAAVAWGVQVILYSLLQRMTRRSSWKFADHLLRRVKRPWRLLVPVLAILVVLPAVESFSPVDIDPLRHVMSLVFITVVVWMLLAALSAAEEFVKCSHSLESEDNYSARRAYTQVTVLKRAAAAFVVLVGISLALMTFPRVRQLGTSLLASAGAAGLIIGLAARPILENLIAGVQIALTQPFNIDDVVIIEGEWGWIEEIRTTYVVVRIWDQRRLIVPLAKFIQEPFQNWTRRTAQILGTVFVHVDYTVPVPAVREELDRIVRSTSKWDGRVCVLQVTNATERTVELRALVSAGNSPAAWDLRVYVREKLIEFLQRDYPHALPRSRVEVATDFTGDAYHEKSAGRAA